MPRIDSSQIRKRHAHGLPGPLGRAGLDIEHGESGRFDNAGTSARRALEFPA